MIAWVHLLGTGKFTACLVRCCSYVNSTVFLTGETRICPYKLICARCYSVRCHLNTNHYNASGWVARGLQTCPPWLRKIAQGRKPTDARFTYCIIGERYEFLPSGFECMRDSHIFSAPSTASGFICFLFTLTTAVHIRNHGCRDNHGSLLAGNVWLEIILVLCLGSELNPLLYYCDITFQNYGNSEYEFILVYNLTKIFTI